MGTDVFVLGDDQSYAASMANDYTLKPSSEMSGRSSSRAHIQEVAAEVLSKENGTGKVFSIYGTGGLGKTFLMEELYSDFIHRFTHNTVVKLHKERSMNYQNYSESQCSLAVESISIPALNAFT